MKYIKEHGYLYITTKRFVASLFFIIFFVCSIPSAIRSGSFFEFVGCLLFIIALCFLSFIPEFIYSKSSSGELWSKWSECHSTQNQKNRINRALISNELVPIKIDITARCGKFASQTSKDRYRTTLCSCTCPDFKKQKLPCKHMYYLANQCNLHVSDIESITPFSASLNNNAACQESIQYVPFNDNMNYMMFDGEGVYGPTKRKRQIHIESFSEQEALEELVSAGYIQDTIAIHRIPFEPPTEAQLSTMQIYHNKIPDKISKNDLSFLISKYMDDEQDADKELINFATGQKVKFSYYTGEKSLYNCIWSKFTLEEKFAFYLLCVEKDITEKWHFEKFEYYKTLSSTYLNDDKFMNSFKKYSSNCNVFYGFIKDNNIKNSYSASRNTNCYKIVASIIS